MLQRTIGFGHRTPGQGPERADQVRGGSTKNYFFLFDKKLRTLLPYVKRNTL